MPWYVFNVMDYLKVIWPQILDTWLNIPRSLIQKIAEASGIRIDTHKR